jgi:3-oxoacyl-[acyl-carrier protein] reductase
VFSLEDRVALVTGGSRGIGKAISLHLAKAGARLAINYVSDEANAKAAAAEIGELGCQVALFKGDVTNAEDAARIVDEATEQFGKIDILVNNAGKTADNLLVRMSEDEWDSVIHANLRGTFLMSRAVVRAMIRARYGRIINITSIDGLVGNAGQSNYSAAKAGVIGFTRSLSRELASRAITVNAVAPGVVKTRMTEVLNEKQWEQLLTRIPMARDGLPEEIAPVVTFLASDEASYNTGQFIAVDGGLT